jgi:hypothetical protein
MSQTFIREDIAPLAEGSNFDWFEIIDIKKS